MHFFILSDYHVVLLVVVVLLVILDVFIVCVIAVIIYLLSRIIQVIIETFTDNDRHLVLLVNCNL